MRDDSYTLTYIVFLIVFVLACTLGQGLLAQAIVPQERAVTALTDQGFTDVQITGKSWFLVGLKGCDSGDALVFYATATNPAGQKVDMMVCSGIIKGATIRSR